MLIIRRDTDALAALAVAKLVDAKLVATGKINTLSGEARSQFVSNIVGQDAIYAAKESEAQAYVSDPNPIMSDYPMLSAETGITAPDAYSLAQLWLNMGAQWRQIAAIMEAARMTALSQIGGAATIDEVEKIVSEYKAL